MTADRAGNQYLLGRYRGDFNDGNPSAPVTDVSPNLDFLFLQKVDLAGDIQWSKLLPSQSRAQRIGPSGLVPMLASHLHQ